MKILFLNYEYPPVGGGAGNATYYLLREYSKNKDLEIDLITSSPTKQKKIEQFSDNVTIHKLPVGLNKENLNFGSIKLLLTYSIKAFFYGVKLIKKNNYDLTHAFFGTPCGFIALIYKFLFGLPYLVSLRGADVPGYKKRFKYLDKFIFRRLNKYFIWKHADKVVTNSDGLKKLALKTAPRQDIAVIPNGVDTETFQPNWNKTMDTIKITPGWTRLEKRKGIDLLFNAVAKIEDKDIEVVIPGTGKELNNLKALADKLDISEQVNFLELGENTQENRKKVAQALSNCHILCLPSDNEGMSNAVLEGMASGLVLLLTNVGGTQELLNPGENGYIIKRDANDIMNKINKIKEDKEKLIQMGRQS
ncbi:MAG: glycosyltransferase family 4 protein, partial [Patescibacteria group bacterium]